MQLIAGSGTTQAQDEAENAPLDGSTSSGGVSASVSASANAEGKDDGYQEGVPGPITRLFVIANRGIANLVQDLILVSKETRPQGRTRSVRFDVITTLKRPHFNCTSPFCPTALNTGSVNVPLVLLVGGDEVTS